MQRLEALLEERQEKDQSSKKSSSSKHPHLQSLLQQWGGTQQKDTFQGWMEDVFGLGLNMPPLTRYFKGQERL